MARIVFAAWGTRGDAQASLILASAMRRRGHDVELAAPGFLAAEAARLEVPFTCLGDDPLTWFGERSWRRRADPRAVMPALLRLFAAQVAPQFGTLVERVERADLVVGQGLAYAAPSVAEAVRVPYRYLSPNVFLLASAHHPALSPALQRLPRWANRLAWRQNSVIHDVVFRRRINLHRDRLGLAPIRAVHPHVFDTSRTIAVFDPELYPPPADVELLSPPVGSIAPTDTDGGVDTETEAFLAGVGPVIAVDFGSMPDRAPEATTRVLVGAARDVGARLLLSRGWAGLGVGAWGSDVHVVSSPAHAVVFPRVDVVVHHGGVGTSATAARAGVAQLVVPHAYDQHASAKQLQSAGMAPTPIARRRLTRDTLAGRLGAVLGNDSMRHRAVRIGRQITARDAVGAAVRRLEEALAGG